MIIEEIVNIEKYIIGSLLLNNGLYHEFKKELLLEDLIDPTHQIVFGVLREFYKRDAKFDYVSVIMILRERHPETRWEFEIPSYAEDIPPGFSASIDQHISKIKAFKGLRVLKTSLQSHISGLTSENVDQTKLDLINSLVDNDETNSEDDAEEISLVLKRFKERFMSSDKNTKTAFLNTGFKDYDEIIDGFGPGSMNIIAARPGDGKSTFALDISIKMAESLFRIRKTQKGKPVVYFSIEMTKDELIKRAISSRSGIPHKKLKKEDKSLLEGEIANFSSSLNHLDTLPLHIVDKSSISSDDIRFICSKIKAKYGEIGAIIIDYLQIMKHNESRFSKSDQIGETTMSLKQLAKDFKCPVFPLAQLNRASVKDGAENERPKLIDLRDSGNIEQDANTVTFLRQETAEDGTTYMNLYVEKNRGGEAGKMTKIRWDKAYFSLFDRGDLGREVYKDLYVNDQSSFQ